MNFEVPRVVPLTVAALVCVLAVVGAEPAVARAEEVIEMLDKTKVAGEIVHYYDGVFTVKAGGNVLKLPKYKVRSIS